MALTIKTRIATGIGVLFSLLAVISIVALIAINLLSGKTENLLAANYKTIRYCNQMMHALDEHPRRAQAYNEFEVALRGQEHNITEVGEKDATASLRAQFELLKRRPEDKSIETGINHQLYAISQLNQRALEQKNLVALRTAANAKVWLSILITLVLLIGLSLAFNLPDIVAVPVKRLTAGIREIATGNYRTRIELDNTEDEFGEMAEAFNRMAARLDEWENSSMARLMFEKSRVESIINQMEDAVLGTDAEGRVLFINRAAAVLYQLNADEIVGSMATALATGNDLLQAVLEGPTQRPLPIIADGKEAFFTVAHKAMQVEGRPLGNVYTLKNVTHYKELDLSKTNLLATISHELKTPISSIKMSAQLLQDARVGGLNEEQRDMVAGIGEDAERMLHLTSELLGLTQIETGNIQLRPERVEVKGIVMEAVAAVGVQAQARNISVSSSLPEGLPAVFADAGKTVVVLVNLLTNAIKHTPEGGTITITATQQGKKMAVVVQDEGEGIDPQYHNRIFERYFQVPGSPKTGTGLGLAIARELMEAQGGSIGVRNGSGTGSAFFIELPFG